MDKERKLCKYCKHSNDNEGVGYLKCKHPNNYQSFDDLVTGSSERALRDSWRALCVCQREDGFFQSIFMGTCGRRAKWYERDLNKFKDEIKKT